MHVNPSLDERKLEVFIRAGRGWAKKNFKLLNFCNYNFKKGQRNNF